MSFIRVLVWLCREGRARRPSAVGVVVLRAAGAMTVALGGAASRAKAQAPKVQAPQQRALTLREVLDSAAARYPAVLAAQARVRSAEGSRITAGLIANPVVGYQVQSNANPPLGPGLGATFNQQRTATVTLPLEAIFQRGPRVRRADAEIRAAENEALATRRRATLDAAQMFYRAALAQVGVATSRSLVLWLDSLVAYNRARVAEGAAAGADLIRTQLERDRAAADVTVQEAELARARATLSTFSGMPAADSATFVVTDPLPFSIPSDLGGTALGPASASLADAPEAMPPALSERPDVRAARERVTAAGASIAAERTLIVRQLGLTAGMVRAFGTTSLVAGLSLPLPLFDVNRGEIARAKADRDAARYELAAREQAAAAEFAGAAEAAKLLTNRTRALLYGPETFLSRADEARRIALGAYREGAVPLFQVIDAARAWNAARLTYYGTLYAQQQAVLALVIAAGRDLQASLPTLTRSPASAP